MRIFFIFYTVLVSATLLAEPKEFCSIPFSRSGRVRIIELVEPAESESLAEAKKITKEAVSVSTVVSTLNGFTTTQVAQGSRSRTLSEIVSCDDDSSSFDEKLPWAKSPTQLSVGNSTLKHQLGAVVGNWATLAGTAATWTLVAFKFGTAKTGYPGGIVFPVLLLLTPSVGSSLTLIRSGTLTQQFVGGSSLAVHFFGAGTIAVFLHPKHFGARWDAAEGNWIDIREDGYVGRYNMLFNDYRGGRQWFMSAELLMSIVSGVLSSFKAADSNCRDLVIAAAATSVAYASSILLLRPHNSRVDLILFGSVASAQALTLSIYSAALWAGSNHTKEKTKTVTEYVLMVSDWALVARSVYELVERFHSLYRSCFSDSVKTIDLVEDPLLQVVSPEEEPNTFESQPDISPATSERATSPNPNSIEIFVPPHSEKSKDSFSGDSFSYLPKWLRDAAREQQKTDTQEERELYNAL